VHRGVVSSVEDGPAIAEDWCARARCTGGMQGVTLSVRVAVSLVAFEGIKRHVPYERSGA
jgi:hypothetical protein